jgi:hypothetical protein
MKWDELIDFGWLCHHCRRVFKEAMVIASGGLVRVAPYACPSCGRVDLDPVAIYNEPRDYKPLQEAARVEEEASS